MRNDTLRVVAVLALGSSFLASPVEAQLQWVTPGETGFEESPTEDELPISGGGSLELTIFGGGVQVLLADADATSFSALLQGAVMFDLGNAALEVGTALGFTWGEARQAFTMDDDGAGATNPWIYAAHVYDWNRILRVRAGLGLGFPLDPRTLEDGLAMGYAAATYGLENAWLWAGDRFSLVPFATVEAMPIQYLYTAASLHLGVLIPTSDMGGDTDVDFQLALAAGGRFGPILAALRFRMVWVPTDNAGPEAYLSLEPFVRAIFEFTRITGFAELRMTINLDDPLGFSFDQYKVWGLHFAGGIEI